MAVLAFLDRRRQFDGSDVVGNVNLGEAGRDIVQNFFAGASPAEPTLPWYDLSPEQDLFTWLRWPGRLTELVGRERETALLRDWAHGPGALRARFVSGPGGVGKSRLAAEVAQSLREAGWTAGFVRLDQPAILPVRRPGAFLILDYPEEGRAAVRALLRDLAALEAPAQHRVRLLLLSRHGPELWQSEIDAAGAGARFDALTLALQPLDDPEQAYRVFCSARQRVPVPAAPAGRGAVDPAAFRAWLAQEPAHRLPLFIAAAAIHSVLEPDRPVVALAGAAVIDALVRHERRRLAGEAERNGLNPDLLARLAAFAAIRGPLGEADLRRLAAPALEIGLPPVPVIDALRPTGRIEHGRFPAPGPDLIAAALLLRVFGERPERAPDCCGRRSPIASRSRWSG